MASENINIPQNPSDSEKEQLDYIQKFGVTDKDAQIIDQDPNKNQSRKSSKRSRIYNTVEEDLESVDLHGCSVSEAIAMVEDQIHTFEIAKIKKFRVIHGGGNPGYGPIKKALDRQFRGPLKNKVKSFKIENYNSGSSIVYLK